MTIEALTLPAVPYYHEIIINVLIKSYVLKQKSEVQVINNFASDKNSRQNTGTDGKSRAIYFKTPSLYKKMQSQKSYQKTKITSERKLETFSKNADIKLSSEVWLVPVQGGLGRSFGWVCLGHLVGPGVKWVVRWGSPRGEGVRRSG